MTATNLMSAILCLGVISCPRTQEQREVKRAPAALVGPIPGLRMQGAGCLRELRDRRGLLICQGVEFDEGPSPCMEVEDVNADGGSQSLSFGSGCDANSIVSGYLGFSLYYLETAGRGLTFICEGAPIGHLRELAAAQSDCYRTIGRGP